MIISLYKIRRFDSFTLIPILLIISFKTMGSGDGLGQAIVVAGVLLLGALTSFVVIDRVGRRSLLIGGGLSLFGFQLATALVMKYKFDPFNPEDMAQWVENLILALICLFTFCFG